MSSGPRRVLESAILFALLALPSAAMAATAGNPLCPGEEVPFNPGNGEDIILPGGFNVSVIASGLNFPTGIAFRGNKQRFEVMFSNPEFFPPAAARRSTFYGHLWKSDQTEAAAAIEQRPFGAPPAVAAPRWHHSSSESPKPPANNA